MFFGQISTCSLYRKTSARLPAIPGSNEGSEGNDEQNGHLRFVAGKSLGIHLDLK